MSFLFCIQNQVKCFTNMSCRDWNARDSLVGIAFSSHPNAAAVKFPRKPTHEKSLSLLCTSFVKTHLFRFFNFFFTTGRQMYLWLSSSSRSSFFARSICEERQLKSLFPHFVGCHPLVLYFPVSDLIWSNSVLQYHVVDCNNSKNMSSICFFDRGLGILNIWNLCLSLPKKHSMSLRTDSILCFQLM